MSENQKFLAVLIDGDNTQPALIPQILNAVNKYGHPIIKKIYGDWSQEHLKSWQPFASKHNLEIAHHYAASSGKNATDIALVIDAMDILHQQGNKLNGFCIVSSDSDFTYLARRIRKKGLIALGIGKDSSQTLKDAYDHYITIESLQIKTKPSSTQARHVPASPTPVGKKAKPSSEVQKFSEAYKHAVKDKDGWVTLSVIGSTLRELYPDYKPLIYKDIKHGQLKKVVEKMMVDYPNIIELNSDSQHPQMRIKK